MQRILPRYLPHNQSLRQTVEHDCGCPAGSAVILAGGKGSRFGGDKKEIIFGGEQLIDTLIARLRQNFNEIIVSSNTKFTREGVITVQDEIGAGPLAGIYSALKICAGEYLYVTACDMPFISPEYIERLKELAIQSKCAAAVARRADGFLEPFNAFYHKSALEKIAEHLGCGEYKIGYLLSKLNVLAIEEFDNKQFFNINRKEDLQTAESLR